MSVKPTPAWQEILAMFERHGLTNCPARLRDELVVHLVAYRTQQAAQARCREEWSGVNDPPCHPSDDGWKPCPLCIVPTESNTQGEKP